MATPVSPSSAYLTSATDFRGIPISQLLASIGYYEPTLADVQEQQRRYHGTPSRHASSMGGAPSKSDPRKRAKASRLESERRASERFKETMKARKEKAQTAAAEKKAKKATSAIMGLVGSVTGGGPASKKAATKKPSDRFPMTADEASGAMMPSRAYEDRRTYSSKPGYVAPVREQEPVFERGPTPTQLMQATPEQIAEASARGDEWARKYAFGDVDLLKQGLAERRGEFGPSPYARGSIPEERAFNEAANLARDVGYSGAMKGLEIQTEKAQRDFERAQARLRDIQRAADAQRQAEIQAQIEGIEAMPTGMFGNLTPSSVFNPKKFRTAYVR
jgi:hypothetical protein